MGLDRIEDHRDLTAGLEWEEWSARARVMLDGEEVEEYERYPFVDDVVSYPDIGGYDPGDPKAWAVKERG